MYSQAFCFLSSEIELSDGKNQYSDSHEPRVSEVLKRSLERGNEVETSHMLHLCECLFVRLDFRESRGSESDQNLVATAQLHK
jgi:hypothetical protein